MSAEAPHYHEVLRPIAEFAQAAGQFIIEKIIPSEAVELPEVEDATA